MVIYVFMVCFAYLNVSSMKAGTSPALFSAVSPGPGTVAGTQRELNKC